MNRLLRLIEMGVISEDDPEVQNELARLMAMPQPRHDMEAMPANSMRFESGPDAGRTVSMDFPQQQPQQPAQKLGAEVEVVGKGKGRYSQDGRSVVFADGSTHDMHPTQTKRDIAEWFAREKAKQGLQKGMLDQRRGELDMRRDELGMEQTREQIEASRAARDPNSPMNTAKAGSKAAEDARKKAESGQNTLELLDAAEPLIGQATESMAGTAVDKIAGFFGGSLPGAEATAKLQTIAGQLVAKMPRMEGPQSNYDVRLYQDMAGRLADSTVPAEQRLAALQQIRALNAKYAPQGQQPQGAKRIQSDADYNALPSGAKYIAPDGSLRTKR